MNVNSATSAQALYSARLTAQNSTPVAAAKEAGETSASEAAESRSVQAAEGELGGRINTYA